MAYANHSTYTFHRALVTLDIFFVIAAFYNFRAKLFHRASRNQKGFRLPISYSQV